MKTLSIEKMENIEGGGGWDCFFTVAGLAGIGVSAVLAPPAGAALAATIVASGVGFGGFVYSMYKGACSSSSPTPSRNFQYGGGKTY